MKNKGSIKTILFVIVFVGLVCAIAVMNQRILKEINQASITEPIVNQGRGNLQPVKKAKRRPDLVQTFAVQEDTQTERSQAVVVDRKPSKKKIKAVYEQPLDDVILVQ